MQSNHSGRLFAAPVREHDGRRTMRSVADALTRLRECGELAEDEHIEIKTSPIQLPNGRDTGFVVVVGPPRPLGAISVVRMPSAAQFRARTTLGERCTYPIGKLNGAVCDCAGNAQLATGDYVHAVELIPATGHYELTFLQEVIVRLTLKCLGEEERCSAPLHATLPGVAPLRYDAIATIRIRRLKAVQSYIADRIPVLSPYVVAKALAGAGMKLPRGASKDGAITIAP